jgi:hypothetical protein
MEASMVALVLGELAFVAFVLWVAAPFVQDRARRRAELQARVLERFGTAQELVAFLEGEPGRRFQESLSGRRLTPLGRILRGVQAGVVLIALGLGLAIAFGLLRDPDLLVAALAAVALGVGFLVAAGVSHRLCSSWGLLKASRSDPVLPGE